RFCGGSIHADDLGMSVWRTSKPQVKHLAQLDIIAELAPPAQKTILLLTRKRRPNPTFFFGRSHPLVSCSAACNPSINFCTFFLPSGSSKPPATDVRPPKICASPCHATLV